LYYSEAGDKSARGMTKLTDATISPVERFEVNIKEKGLLKTPRIVNMSLQLQSQQSIEYFT